ncbi:hypothetical protein I8748_19050 [Nostoc sp. CENA67]|uniref:Uncharacterized protein n=1 Tax=Amazonocrinis nigriterrae CENA67 TaxID=2794033 RepID=A0A8J7L8A3_9NOST|nr:hypothetical protein [Amazonocrinis nigriterrae]MBH8564259.1 hypothetical protein [Amazonocrinis nigriterrae CENA67]
MTKTTAKQHSQQVSLDCVVENSESAKQETTEWQPGSAQAQIGIKGLDKDFLCKKFLWLPANHHSWWRCQH